MLQMHCSGNARRWRAAAARLFSLQISHLSLSLSMAVDADKREPRSLNALLIFSPLNAVVVIVRAL